MTYYRFPENRIWKILFGLFLFAQLMLTRSGMSGAQLGFMTSQILMIGILAMAGLAFLAVNHANLKGIILDKRMIFAGCFCVVMLLPMLLKQDWQLMYFTVLLGFVMAVLLSYFVTLAQTAKYYVLILCALSVYSILATYVLRRLPDAGILPIPRFSSSAEFEYYNFGLAYVSITHVASRNFGIFREPGVHQFFLLTALYLADYTVEWKQPWQMWLASGILAAAILSTMATGGVIALGLYVFVVFFEKKLYKIRWVRIAAAVAAVAAVILVAVSVYQKNGLYWFLYNTLLEKFINRTDSVTERAAAVSANISYFLRNPLVGVPFAQVLHGVSNNTVSTLIVFAAYGIFGGLLHLLGWFALVWKRERSILANLGLLAVLFMGFNTQNLTWDLYFWLFPVMALLERGIPLLKSIRKG